jgi:hypothetical protein
MLRARESALIIRLSLIFEVGSSIGGISMDTAMVRRLAGTEIDNGLGIIRRSFATVAADFGLTEQNTPTHPAFLSMERFREMLAKPVIPIGAFAGTSQVGFVAVEKGNEGAFYVERLAVLPQHRHHRPSFSTETVVSAAWF